jgi:hypothetical protein
MARALRVAFAGAWFRVTARGNERFVVFRRDADQRKWLEWLANCWSKRIAQDKNWPSLRPKQLKC